MVNRIFQYSKSKIYFIMIILFLLIYSSIYILIGEHRSLKESFIERSTITIGMCGGIVLLLLMYYYFNIHCKSKIINNMVLIVVLGLISFFLIYHCSYCSPSYLGNSKINGMYGADMSIFTLMGNMVADGKILYKDAFDHKGPIIFFLYACKEMINPIWFLCFIMVICLTISFFLCFLIGEVLSNRCGGLISVFMSLIYYVLVMDEGGLTEDFNLPFIMLSVYLVTKYLKQNKKELEHPKYYSIVYGITIAISICLRSTNCMMICAYGACITIYLLMKKKYLNLMKNTVYFMVGFFIIMIPIIMYFMLEKSLQDFWFGTIGFNIDYSTIKITHTIFEYRTMFLYLIPAILVILLALREEGSSKWILSIGAISMLYLLRLAVFPHYYILVLPLVPIAIGLLVNRDFILKRKENNGLFFYIKIVIYVLIFCVITLSSVKSFKDKYSIIAYCSSIQQKSRYVQEIEEQIRLIPIEERDCVAGYDLMANWYLVADILPCYSIFMAHNWWPYISQEMYNRVVDEFNSLEAKWIIVRNDITLPEVKEIVENNYEIIQVFENDTGVYTLYKKSK